MSESGWETWQATIKHEFNLFQPGVAFLYPLKTSEP